MKKSLFLLLALLLNTATIYAQTPIRTTIACAFSGKLPANLNGFDSDEDAKSAVNHIMKQTGLPANFEIMVSDSIENACAVVFENKRYILYNGAFMKSVRIVTGSNYAEISVLAHEIGHHLCGHTVSGLGSNPATELEADKFSGFVAFRLGATLEQAEIVMQKIGADIATSTHPAKADRLKAIDQGWFDAQALSGKEISIKVSETSKKPTKKPSVSAKTQKPAPRPTPQSNAPAAAFHSFKVTQINGALHIIGTVDLLNLYEKNCVVTAWFFDQQGQALRDIDQTYRARSGGVATSLVVHPIRQQVQGQAITLMIPRAELHLDTGRHLVITCLGINVDGTDFLQKSTPIGFIVEN